MLLDVADEFIISSYRTLNMEEGKDGYIQLDVFCVVLFYCFHFIEADKKYHL